MDTKLQYQWAIIFSKILALAEITFIICLIWFIINDAVFFIDGKAIYLIKGVLVALSMPLLTALIAAWCCFKQYYYGLFLTLYFNAYYAFDLIKDLITTGIWTHFGSIFFYFPAIASNWLQIIVFILNFLVLIVWVNNSRQFWFRKSHII